MTSETIIACSIWRALEVVGDVPVLLILEQAFIGTRGFEEFVAKTCLPRSVVSDRLKKLASEECLEKRIDNGKRRASYRLTRKGRDLLPVALSMLGWQHRWEADQRSFKVQITHLGCNEIVEPIATCATCRSEVSPMEVDWMPGPGLTQVIPDYSRRRRSSKDILKLRGKGALVDTVIGLYGDRWSALIVRAMFTGIHRFDQIQQDTLMATNILSGRIDELIESGILVTSLYSQHPPRYEYHLTPKGRDLYPITLGLLQWGDQYYADEKGPPLILYHRPCGNSLKMEIVCGYCDEKLRNEEMAARIV